MLKAQKRKKIKKNKKKIKKIKNKKKIKAQKHGFDQQTACKAPIRSLKYTTLIYDFILLLRADSK